MMRKMILELRILVGRLLLWCINPAITRQWQKSGAG
jgi:hypothetical protein